MHRVRLTDDAKADAARAYGWYFNRNPSAAYGFEAALQEALNQIAEAPDRWATFDDETRFHVFNRYPYYVVYYHDDRDVIVVAVAHGAQEAGYWKR